MENDIAQETAQETDKETLNVLVSKVEILQKKIDELMKKQQMLQDAFYRSYEDQRRRERSL